METQENNQEQQKPSAILVPKSLLEQKPVLALESSEEEQKPIETLRLPEEARKREAEIYKQYLDGMTK